jgi:hypothetical protein
MGELALGLPAYAEGNRSPDSPAARFRRPMR